MPAQRTWLGRRKEILRSLEKSTTEEIDRSSVEALFQIQRRAALLTMEEIGPVKKGRQWFVHREDMIRWLRSIDEAADMDDRRRHKSQELLDISVEEDRAVRSALAEQGRPAKHFPLVDEILLSSLRNMPEGTEIDPGRITIHFPASNPLRALEILYALGKALANDWESFVRLNTGQSEEAPEVSGQSTSTEHHASLPRESFSDSPSSAG